MKNRAERGWFWVSLAVTLSVLTLLVGMAVVDVRCRQMGWGNHTPPFLSFHRNRRPDSGPCRSFGGQGRV